MIVRLACCRSHGDDQTFSAEAKFLESRGIRLEIRRVDIFLDSLETQHSFGVRAMQAFGWKRLRHDLPTGPCHPRGFRKFIIENQHRWNSQPVAQQYLRTSPMRK